MLGSPFTPTNPFNIGQFGQFGQMPNLGMGMGYGQLGMPGMQGIGQNIPGMPGIGQIPGMQGLGFGQNIPGMQPYGLFGGQGPLGGLFGGQSPLGGLFGGGQNIPNLPSFTVFSIAVVTPSMDPVAQLVKHITQGGILSQGSILNPYDPFNPLAQLGQQGPFGQFGGQFGGQLPFGQQGPFGQQWGQQSPFGFTPPFLGGRQVVRAYVQTMMGVIPIDLVV